MLRKDDMVRLQHVMRPSNDHVRRYRKILIYLSNDGEKFNGRIPGLPAEGKRIVCAAERVERKVVHLRRHICYDLLIIFFITDLERIDFDRDAQVLLPVQFENEVGHPDIIPEIEGPREDVVLPSETGDVLPEVHIFMVELQRVAFICFRDQRIVFLLEEQRVARDGRSASACKCPLTRSHRPPPDGRSESRSAREDNARLQLVGRYKWRRITARSTLDRDFQVVRVYENDLAVLSPAKFHETCPSKISL